MDPRTPNQLPLSRPSGYSFGTNSQHAPIPLPLYSLRQPQASTQSEVTRHHVIRNDEQVQFRGITAPNHAPDRPGQTTFVSPFSSEAARHMTCGSSMRRNSHGPEAPYKDEMIRRLDDRFVDARELIYSPSKSLQHLPSAFKNSIPSEPPIEKSGRDLYARRSSHLGMYGITADPPPPPPPPFSGHRMPPPSPQHSQFRHSEHFPSSRGPIPPPLYSVGRDLPASIPRPESSMSISSLLGSDSERTSRENIANNYRDALSRPYITTIPSPGSQSMPARSPTGSISGGHQQYLPQSPNSGRHYSASAAASRFRAYSGGAQTRPYTAPKVNGKIDFEAVTPGLSRGDVLVRNASLDFQNSDLQRFSSNTRKERHDSKRAVDRLNSQPNGVMTPSLHEPNMSTTPPALHEQYNRIPHEAEKPYEHTLETSIVTKGYHGIQSEYSARETRAPIGRKSELMSFRCAAQQEQANSTGSSEAKIAAKKAPLGNIYDRTAVTLRNQDGSTARGHSNSSRSPDSIRPSRVERFNVTSLSQEDSRLSPAHLHLRLNSLVDDTSVTPVARLDDTSRAAGGDELGAGQTFHNTKMREDSQHPPLRSSLALFVENNKRGGRVSPLPQAVQGAQRQSMTPASDPGIKSEFARMFSGIGSGVGSGMPRPAAVNSGPPSPFTRRSPTKIWEAERPLPFGGRNNLVELNKPQVASRGGRRSRKTKEEEIRSNGTSVDDLGTSSTKGMKRGQHPPHHHQKLPNNYHRHRHLDESKGGALSLTSINPNENIAKRKNDLSEGGSFPSPSAHNHHHHHHHHHRQNKTGASLPFPRKPTTTVNSKALLDQICALPRYHLGSTLYHPSIDPAPDVPHTSSGYTITAKPLPRFEGKENCTFTVRIPHFYLAEDEREAICQRRALWGTGVYTDDSDPVATAIHSGWIRGAWTADVDITLFDLDISDEAAAEGGTPSKDRVTVPTKPLIPPGGKDLHLTLLVLPPLQAYASSVAHGLKSRAWGDTHDGMSFMIHRLAWVDGGIGDMEERGGEARKKRLKRWTDSNKTTSRGPPIRFGASMSRYTSEIQAPTIAV